MNIHPIKYLRRRLFFKIALVFSLSLIVIIFLFTLTMRFILSPPRFPVFSRLVVDQAEYLIREIGTPPNIEKSRQLQQKLGIQIRIAGDGVNWAGNPDMIDFNDIDLAPVPERSHAFADFTPYGFCVIIERGANRFLLVVDPKGENFLEMERTFLLILGIIYVALILSIMFFVIQWLLRDVKVLAVGMQQISAGVLGHRMSSRRQDELGQLVSSFNTMSEKIQEMIRNRERLLLDVSHELRSPLTRIKLALEFLEASGSKSAIRDDVLELETMISELLESERLSSPYGGLKRSVCPLAVVIHEVCQGFRDRRPGITIMPFSESLSLELDRERFKIMLRNILDNALRYSEPDSHPVEVEVKSTLQEIIISMHDHGKGIPAQDIPHIFEPFYRVDKSRSKETGGYGLGMNLVQKIMAAHGGRIEVRSRLNLGTTVYLHFNR